MRRLQHTDRLEPLIGLLSLLALPFLWTIIPGRGPVCIVPGGHPEQFVLTLADCVSPSGQVIAGRRARRITMVPAPINRSVNAANPQFDKAGMPGLAVC